MTATVPPLIQTAGNCLLCRHWTRWAPDSCFGNCHAEAGRSPLTRQDYSCDDYAYGRDGRLP